MSTLAIAKADALAAAGAPRKRWSVWDTWGLAFLAPYVVVFLVFVLYPVCYGLWLARHPDSYVALADDPVFETAVINTIVFLLVAINVKMAPEMLLMSKVVWDKLPKAEQDMIRAAAKESVAFQRKKWDEQEAKSLATVKAGGAEIIEVDKKSFQGVMQPVYDKFITTPDLKRLVKAIQDTP